MLTRTRARHRLAQLLKLRNPWGSGTEWKGAWSDKSPEWTPRTKKLVNYNPAEGAGLRLFVQGAEHCGPYVAPAASHRRADARLSLVIPQVMGFSSWNLAIGW